MKIKHESDYATRRRKEYPPLVDQVDAIMKGGAELAAMQERVAAVRAKFPKAKGSKPA